MSTHNDEDFAIDANDFKSFEICIGVDNTTARTEVKNYETASPKGESSKKEKLLKMKVNDLVQLIELQEQGVVLQLPPNSCSTGHNLTLTIEVISPAKRVEFETTSKVKAVERMEDAQWVTLQFLQFKDEDWKAFNKVYSSRQDQILDFFESVKG